MLRVVSLNLNGIRAAWRKGLAAWLAAEKPDVVCMQELKAQAADLTDEMTAPAPLRGYFSFAARPGYSGVGIYTRHRPQAVTHRFGDAGVDGEGRFIRVDFPACSVVSLYMPSGSSGEVRQEFKYRLMKKFRRRFAAYQRETAESGRQFILCGDWNIAHTQQDIRNWRGNQKNSGFLPEEREWFGALLAAGWVDVFRHLNDSDGEYTWWSNRGNAWANNVGWRIDYQLATTGIAGKATRAAIYRAERFSDHAPLTIDYRASRASRASGAKGAKAKG